MANLIKDIIIDYNFVDICSSKVVPTWDNERTDDGYLAKRLDQFLLHEHKVERLGSV